MGRLSFRIVLISSILTLFLFISCRSTTTEISELDNVPQVDPSNRRTNPTATTETVEPADPNTPHPNTEPRPTNAPPEATQQPRPSTSGLVTLAVSMNSCRLGEMVEFVVSNNSDSDIYYTYGCSWPNIRKIEDGEQVGVTVNILDEEPPLFSLAPGQSHECMWDQVAYQDPNRESPARFQHYNEPLQVPSGVYQFRLDYFLDPEDVYTHDKHKTVWTQLFSIE